LKKRKMIPRARRTGSGEGPKNGTLRMMTTRPNRGNQVPGKEQKPEDHYCNTLFRKENVSKNPPTSKGKVVK